jgi:hypothetical protein
MGRLPTDYGRSRKIFGLAAEGSELGINTTPVGVRRGFSAGSRHLQASKQVLLMRKLYAKGNVTQTALAERFGLSLSNVKSILARRSWKHI